MLGCSWTGRPLVQFSGDREGGGSASMTWGNAWTGWKITDPLSNTPSTGTTPCLSRSETLSDPLAAPGPAPCPADWGCEHDKGGLSGSDKAPFVHFCVTLGDVAWRWVSTA